MLRNHKKKAHCLFAYKVSRFILFCNLRTMTFLLFPEINFFVDNVLITGVAKMFFLFTETFIFVSVNHY